MQPGDIVGERFVVQHRVGAGGMGTVYYALDREHGSPVALKILHPSSVDTTARFAREARVLAQLEHSGIVRYVASGDGDGKRFLAMEWLEGEDLAARLRRAPLSVGESIALVLRVAEALAFAHAHGVVHRDIKPANVFLPRCSPASAKVLDFGIARDLGVIERGTDTGVIIGTLGYLAPEQARGDRELSARADVFALGCVFLECLTGRPAFEGANAIAILSKILVEDAPRIAERRGDLPRELCDLVQRMLARDPRQRPDGASAVLKALSVFGALDGPAPSELTSPVEPAALVAAHELQFVTIVLAGRSSPEGGATLDAEAEVIRQATRAGATCEVLVDGSLLFVFAAAAVASDRAASAAGIGLTLRRACPSRTVVIATGRAVMGAPISTLPSVKTRGVGDAVDRAAALLHAGPAAHVQIDSVTAGLLDSRYEVIGATPVHSLVGEHVELAGLLPREPTGGLLSDVDDAVPEGAAHARPLLGKPTPCVGRDKELALLEATFAECIAEPVARAVLVTAPAGTGKSRLAIELVRRVSARDPMIWIARADPVGAGSSLALVRQLVRSGGGSRDPQISDFLGELVGTPPAEPGPALLAARKDPASMGEWMRRSFEDWVAAECAARPLLIVLEDLHWGDAASVAYLDGVLRKLAERPVLVLALARPEVHDVFASLWSAAGTQEIRLGGLTRRAAERLVRAVLGASVAASQVERIVDRADGNAYYLEELIRRVAEGTGDELPETVLAMVQSRLARLEPEARRLLRTASVFGEVFWRGAVATLFGDGAAGWLDALVKRELVSASASSRFPGELEYTFRHGLLREAAYVMLTEGDRPTAHRLAAEWLERAGEKDALVIAEHFERGGQPARAIPWLLAAARTAYDGARHETVLALAERAVGHGAAGETLGHLRRLQATSASAVGDIPMLAERARAASAALPAGSPMWIRSVGAACCADAILGDRDGALAKAGSLLDFSVELDPTVALGLVWPSTALALTGRANLPLALLERLEATGRGDAACDAFVGIARALAAWLGKRPRAAGIAEGLAACDHFVRVADLTAAAAAALFVGLIHAEAGDLAAQHAAFAEANRLAHRARNTLILESSSFSRARAWAFAGRFAEATEAASEIVPRNLPHRTIGAWAYFARGELEAAWSEATRAFEEAPGYFRETTVAVLGAIALGRGDHEAALQWVELGLADLAESEHRLEISLLLLTRARALDAAGRSDEAQQTIAAARARILRIAGAFDDGALRESYLHEIEPHTSTLALAARWLG